jgi:hypothetical protein
MVRKVAVEEAHQTPSGFSVTASGTTSEAGVVLLATGMRFEAEGGTLARVLFADGSSDERAALFFTPSPLPAQRGCELDQSGAV